MRSLRFFWTYISYRKDLLALALTVSGLVTAAELFLPWIVMRAIDAVVEERSLEQLNGWAIKALVLLVIFYVLHAVMIRIDAQLILRSSYNLRRRLYAHIVNRGMPFFERYQTGELIHRVVTDTDNFDEDVEDLVSELLFDILTIIGVFIFMMVLDYKMALIVTLFMIANAAMAGYFGRPLLNLEKSIQATGARLVARLQEVISGIRTVKGFTNEDYELARLDKDNRKILKKELTEGRIESIMEPMADSITFFGLILVVWYGGYQIVEGTLTIGALVAFIAYMEIIAEPLEEMEGYYRDYLSCRAMAERIQDLLDDDEAVADEGTARIDQDQIPIEFSAVAFGYEGRGQGLVQDISFQASPGEIIAIVGRNGAGKSTLLNLIHRFYDPDEGEIKAAGTDLRELDLNAWRRSVGTMSQDTFLFHGTIMDNIAYGDPKASSEDIILAAEKSGLAELVAKFPKALDTVVGERGARLSGGERQRVSLARLFLRNPKVVLLDEPTAHLDGEALSETLEVIESLAASRTTLIVTHQLEAIQLANSVLFLDDGRIAGRGTHEDLMSDNRSYQLLWKNQTTGNRRVRRTKKRSWKDVEGLVSEA